MFVRDYGPEIQSGTTNNIVAAETTQTEKDQSLELSLDDQPETEFQFAPAQNRNLDQKCSSNQQTVQKQRLRESSKRIWKQSSNTALCEMFAPLIDNVHSLLEHHWKRVFQKGGKWWKNKNIIEYYKNYTHASRLPTYIYIRHLIQLLVNDFNLNSLFTDSFPLTRPYNYSKS